MNPVNKNDSAMADPIPITSNPIRVTIDHIDQPAYMLNYNLEIIWFNEASEAWLGNISRLPDDSHGRQINQFISRGIFGHDLGNQNEFRNIHNEAGGDRLVSNHSVTALNKSAAQKPPIRQFNITLNNQDGGIENFHIFVSYFREGMLFIFINDSEYEDSRESLLQILSRRDVVIRDLLRKHLPVHTDVSVLVADLQNSTNICLQLPPEEYFELINQMWGMVEPIFRKFYGTHGKHVGDGMVYYFLPQPDCSYLHNAILCADQLREEMRKLNHTWKLRKNWPIELRLKIGLHAGREWLGTYHVDSKVEFTVLGDTINQAARLSDFAQGGTIWASKALISKLDPEYRKQIRYGIRNRDEQGVETLIESTFSSPETIQKAESISTKLRDIASLPIAEVIEVKYQD